MALTVGQCATHIARVLDMQPGQVTSPGTVEIVNAAGLELTSAHPWRWQSNTTTTLDITANVGYVNLPADVRAIKNVRITDSLVGSTEPTTVDEIVRMREGAVQVKSPHSLWWAVSSYLPPAGGDPVWRLEFWPYRSADVADGITLLYDAGWKSVTDDNDLVTVPPWMKGLFIDMCEAVAQGWYDSAQGTRRLRVAEVLRSDSFMHAVKMDGGISSTLGPIQNGAAASRRHREPWQHGYRYGENLGGL